jgi:hypothetical protein
MLYLQRRAYLRVGARRKIKKMRERPAVARRSGKNEWRCDETKNKP